MNPSLSKIREIRVRAVQVPMAHPHRTASGVIAESPLVLTDIFTEDDGVGHSMVFTYTAAALKPTADLIKNLGPLVVGEPLAPAEIAQSLARRFRLLGTQGLVGMALAAIDMALWDALARKNSISLTRLLGGIEKPLPAYGTVGFDGLSGSARAAEEWAKRKFKGVKAKIGYPTVQQDLEVIRAIRKAVGDEMAIMVDYNQCLTPTEAVQRLHALDEEGLTWVEEPVMAHDYDGHAFVARAIHTPIQMRRKLVGPERRATCPSGRGLGLRNVRRDENRRRNWLASRRSPGGSARRSSFKPPVARDQRAIDVRNASGPLPRVRRLVESHS